MLGLSSTGQSPGSKVPQPRAGGIFKGDGCRVKQSLKPTQLQPHSQQCQKTDTGGWCLAYCCCQVKSLYFQNAKIWVRNICSKKINLVLCLTSMLVLSNYIHFRKGCKSLRVEVLSEGACNPSNPTEVKTSKFLTLELPVFHIIAALCKNDIMTRKAGVTALRRLSCMPNIALSLSPTSTPLPVALTHMPQSKPPPFSDIHNSQVCSFILPDTRRSFDNGKWGRQKKGKI